MNKYEDMNLDNILSDKEQLAFNAFSPRDKKLFIMIEVEKKSKTDVAAEFGISYTRVCDVYKRIKRRLEKLLKNFGQKIKIKSKAGITSKKLMKILLFQHL